MCGLNEENEEKKMNEKNKNLVIGYFWRDI